MRERRDKESDQREVCEGGRCLIVGRIYSNRGERKKERDVERERERERERESERASERE